MILIGDPKQLPATTFQPESNVTKYNRSLFERIIDNGIKPYFLDEQYRMHPKIREFPSNQFYDNKLKDGELVLSREFPGYLKRLEANNVQFVDFPFSRERIKQKSYENEVEGEASIHICNALFEESERTKRGNENISIGIITPYKQQTKLINQMVRKMVSKNYQKYIQVNTVDSFQGQEKDVIIFSTVRATGKDLFRQNMIGFLQDERRMNVALTRARFSLIVLGHADTLNSNPTWGTYVDFMASKKRYCKLVNKYDLDNIGELVLQGKLLEGESAVYVKKNWGEEYRETLLKSKQVNELKLTDFEIENGGIEGIEAEQGNNDLEGMDINVNEVEPCTLPEKEDGDDDDDDCKLIRQDQRISKRSEKDDDIEKDSNVIRQDIQIIKPTLIEEEYIDLDTFKGVEQECIVEQKKRNRTGISMKEAIENHEEQINMRRIAGGMGLKGLILHKSPVKLEKRGQPIIFQEGPQASLMKRIFATEKPDQPADSPFVGNSFEPMEDIYSQMRQQKIQNLKAKKMQQLKNGTIQSNQKTSSKEQTANACLNKNEINSTQPKSTSITTTLENMTKKVQNKPIIIDPIQIFTNQQSKPTSDSSIAPSALSSLSCLIEGQTKSIGEIKKDIGIPIITIYDQINQQRSSKPTDSSQNRTSSAQNQTSSAQNQTSSIQNRTYSAQNQTYSAQNQTSSAQNQTSSAQNRTTSAQNRTTSVQNQTTSVQNQTSSAQNRTQPNSISPPLEINLLTRNEYQSNNSRRASSFEHPYLTSSSSSRIQQDNLEKDNRNSTKQSENINTKSSAKQLLENIYMKKN